MSPSPQCHQYAYSCYLSYTVQIFIYWDGFFCFKRREKKKWQPCSQTQAITYVYELIIFLCTFSLLKMMDCFWHRHKYERSKSLFHNGIFEDRLENAMSLNPGIANMFSLTLSKVVSKQQRDIWGTHFDFIQSIFVAVLCLIRITLQVKTSCWKPAISEKSFQTSQIQGSANICWSLDPCS